MPFPVAGLLVCGLLLSAHHLRALHNTRTRLLALRSHRSYLDAEPTRGDGLASCSHSRRHALSTVEEGRNGPVNQEVRTVAQAKTGKKKNAAKKHGDKRTSEKTAKKALAKAKRAVETARKAVRNSTKQLRAEAAALAKANKKLDAERSKASKKAPAATDMGAPGLSTRPSRTPPRDAATPKTAPTTKSSAAAPTVAELRRRAKAQKIAGYSRLNKAALIQALDSTPST